MSTTTTLPLPNEQPVLTLNNGKKMPTIGLGTWKGLANECEEMVYNAIKVGYRHIDTASIYQNEKEVGIGIQRAIDDKIVTREELFITTKCWNDRHRDVEVAMKESLERLNLTYVDLYLVHWPQAWKCGTKLIDEGITLVDVWRQMETLVDNGLALSIGVSNYNDDEIEALVGYARIQPVTNQVEIHPYFNNFKLQQTCLKHNIFLTAYSALMPLSDYKFIEWKDITIDPVVVEIAKKHNVSPQQALLRWNIDVGNSVITKSSKIERLQQNFNILSFKLDKDDIEKLNTLSGKRYRNPNDFRLPKQEFFFKDE